jgi:hypothetical protein
MVKPTPIKFNQEEELELKKARDILGIGKDTWGENSITVKRSIKFVIEFNDFIYQKFLNDYPPTIREYLRRRLNG